VCEAGATVLTDKCRPGPDEKVGAFHTRSLFDMAVPYLSFPFSAPLGPGGERPGATRPLPSCEALLNLICFALTGCGRHQEPTFARSASRDHEMVSSANRFEGRCVLLCSCAAQSSQHTPTFVILGWRSASSRRRLHPSSPRYLSLKAEHHQVSMAASLHLLMRCVACGPHPRPRLLERGNKACACNWHTWGRGTTGIFRLLVHRILASSSTHTNLPFLEVPFLLPFLSIPNLRYTPFSIFNLLLPRIVPIQCKKS
jgi:hypothetical protein